MEKIIKKNKLQYILVSVVVIGLGILLFFSLGFPASARVSNLKSFSDGSILFSQGGEIAENNATLFWDNTNNSIRIGQSTSSNLYVRNINALPGNWLELHGENGGVGMSGRGIDIDGGDGGLGDTNGGSVILRPGTKQGSGLVGKIGFQNPSNGSFAFLDLSLLTLSNKTFTFPDISGTFGLLQLDQTWSGLNKFEAGTNSTIYIGSSVKSGCIAMGDSDGSGVTYITANDGVLTASTTKPSICQ
ncbi:hypothetical protein A2716_00125 [candidate division WWE3 bacterium RIFCSPHIGHO2_01_FULL_40_23]|nr:MAG: hypothetical protein A2716_00125 [candidate division WWE3 bacterium RIFCSPHIGHO2_01_FULL_40_23]